MVQDDVDVVGPSVLTVDLGPPCLEHFVLCVVAQQATQPQLSRAAAQLVLLLQHERLVGCRRRRSENMLVVTCH